MTTLDERIIAPTATKYPGRSARAGSDETARWFARVTSPSREPLHISVIDGDGIDVRPAWLKELEVTLNDVWVLPAGWDGGRARAVTPDAVRSLVTLLNLVMDDGVMQPELFPLPDGGLQAEWHAGGHDVELEIESDGSAYAFGTRPDGARSVDDEVAPLNGRGSIRIEPEALLALGEAVSKASDALRDHLYPRWS